MSRFIKILPAFVILILGILISFFIQRLQNEKQLHAKEIETTLLIENETNAINSELTKSFSSLKILKYIFENNKIVTQKEFYNYTAPLLNGNPSLKALSWVPLIRLKDKEKYEKQMEQLGNPDFQIKQQNNKSELYNVRTRPIYFPIMYIEPLADNIRAVGYDLYSSGARKASINRSIEANDVLISSRIKTVQDTLNYSFLGITPVLDSILQNQSNNPFPKVKGLITAVYSVEGILNSVKKLIKNPNAKLVIFDITKKNPECIYGDKNLIASNTQIKQRIINVGGREWELNYILDSSVFKVAESRIYLFSGILISIFLFIIFLTSFIRDEKNRVLSLKLVKEQKVRKVTEKSLSESEEYNRTLFSQSSMGLALTSMDGKLLDINPAYANIIGRTVEETKKLTYWDITPNKYKETEEKLIASLQTTGVYGPYEKEYIHKNGHSVPVRLQGKLIERKGVSYIWSSVEDITSSKKAENALLESEEKFSILFGKASLPAALTKMPGHELVDVNDSWLKLFGFTKEEVIGKTAMEIGINRNEISRKQTIEKITKIRKVSNLEQNLFSKSGDKITILLNLNAVEINGKDFAITSMQDITENKRNEKALKESDELLRLSSELANVAAWEMDLVANSMTRSENHDKLYGLTEVGQWQVNTFMDATHVDDREKCNTFINGSLAAGGPDQYKFDFRILYPDKSIHWLNVIGVVIERNAQGVGIKIRGFITDITDRKQAEEAIVESEEKFKSSFHTNPAAQAILSKDGYFVESNAAFSKLIGFTKEEIIGKSAVDLDLLSLEERKKLAAHAEASGGTIRNAEVKFKIKDGSFRYIMYSIEEILLGGIAHRLSIGIDITDRKEAEEVVKILNQSLEQKVKERTAQLQAMNIELETFTYSVSHDLKAPLRGIEGYSKLLLDLYKSKLNEEAQAFIDTIRSSALQMSQLIDDLLDYSRLDRSELSLAPIKIKDFVNSILSLYQADLETANFKINVKIEDIEIVADSKGLNIALRNLIENAIKFTKGNLKPLIQIEVEEKDVSWIISVNDNGIGFNMKYHQKIFEIFQRLQRAEDFPGTGIGLAMVSKALQRMQGKTWAESIPGIGSTFYLEIPKSQ